MKICVIPDCDKPVRARGWCRKHYTRFLKTGDPMKTLQPPRMSDEDRAQKARDSARSYRERNPDKVKASAARYREANRDKIRENVRNYQRTPEQQRLYARRHNIKKKYGLTLEEFDAMLAAQGGVCWICGNPETRIWNGTLSSLCVDHNHKTGAVRGLLCGECNKNLKDEIEWHMKAIEYLKHFDGDVG